MCEYDHVASARAVYDASGERYVQRSFRFLGKISYSLYLTHVPVIGVVFYLGTKAFGDTKTVETRLILPLVIVLLITGAVAVKLFEEPAVRWSRSLRRRPTPPAPRPRPPPERRPANSGPNLQALGTDPAHRSRRPAVGVRFHVVGDLEEQGARMSKTSVMSPPMIL